MVDSLLYEDSDEVGSALVASSGIRVEDWASMASHITALLMLLGQAVSGLLGFGQYTGLRAARTPFEPGPHISWDPRMPLKGLRPCSQRLPATVLPGADVTGPYSSSRTLILRPTIQPQGAPEATKRAGSETLQILS